MQSVSLKSLACLLQIYVPYHTCLETICFLRERVVKQSSSLKTEALDPFLNIITPYLPVFTLRNCLQQYILDKGCFIPPLTFHEESRSDSCGSLKRCNGGSQINTSPHMLLEYDSLAVFTSHFCEPRCAPRWAHLC